MSEQTIEIPQLAGGQVELCVQFEGDMVWLNRQPLSELFGRGVKTIGRVINNLFKEGELNKDSVLGKYATTAADGETYKVEHYNLDVIVSVRYQLTETQNELLGAA